MRLVLCGFGHMGEAHGRYYRHVPRIQVVGVVDPCFTRLALASEMFPQAQAVTTADQVSTAADTADISSPPAFHATQSRFFLGRRIGVMCEKPAVLDPAEGHALASLANKMGRALHPVHNYLYSPVFTLARKILVERRLGRLKDVRVTVDRQTPARGTASWNPAWREDREIAGGGILVDHGTHWIYALLHLLGSPESVRCSMGMHRGVEHDARLRMTFGGEVRATVQLTWKSQRRATSLVMNGTHGRLAIHDGQATVSAEGNQRTFPLPGTDDSQTHDSWFPEVFKEYERVQEDVGGASPEWAYAVDVSRVVALSAASHRTGDVWLPYPQPAG